MKISFKNVLSAQVKLLNPHDLLAYLLDTGWERTESPGEPEIVICVRKTKEDIYSVLFSLDPNAFADYKEALERTVIEIARYEKNEPEKVILAIQNPSDALRFRIVSEETENGIIRLGDGVKLLQEVQATIRAAACDALKPGIPFHVQEYSPVKNWVETCKLGQTERGSFIVSVLCPLKSSSPNLFDGNKDAFVESLTRKTTTHLLQSLAEVKREIDSIGLESVASENNGQRASANLLSAVVQLGKNLTTAKTDAIEIGARRYGAKSPASVIFSHDYFPEMEKIAAKLRTSLAKEESSAKKFYVGKISSLKAEPNAERRLDGTITFHFLDENNRSKKAMIVLSIEDYAQATEAHNNGLPVRVYGFLKQKGPRKFIIENAQFEVWK